MLSFTHRFLYRTVIFIVSFITKGSRADIIVPDKYPTIKAAITACKKGETVRVKNGVYKESLIFKDGINLIGESVEKTIIQSDEMHAIFAEKCSTGQISNFTVKMLFNAKTLKNKNPTTIKDTLNGIGVVGSSIEISNCIIQDFNYYAIGLWGACKPVINDCTMGNCKYGIFAQGAGCAPVIKNNFIAHQLCYGVYMLDQAKGVIENNSLNNMVRGAGIYVSGQGTSPAILKNSIYNCESGIYYDKGAKGSASSNICTENRCFGIGLTNINTSPVLRNNKCMWNIDGIRYMDGASGTAEHNICSENTQFGIGVYHKGTSPFLKYNQCIKNKMSGIVFVEGAKGVLTSNTCKFNEEAGIVIMHTGTQATLTKNICRDNYRSGIIFNEGAKGTIEDNHCEKNKESGILIFESSTNVTVKNNRCKSNNIDGIAFVKGASGIADGNIVEKNQGEGIVVDIGSNVTLTNNQSKNNQKSGLLIYKGGKATLSNNTISDNSGGDVVDKNKS